MGNDVSCQEYLTNGKFGPDFSFFENHTYNGDPVLWKSPDSVGYIKILLYVILIIGGLLGNLSVILTIALVKTMRSTINYYVANLAVADAMICIICMLPHALEVYTDDKFVLGEFMCKFNPFTQMTCLTSSVLTLCAISCDRYIAVFRPLEVKTTKKKTNLIIVSIWIVSVGVSIPFLFFKKYIIMKWLNFLEPKCGEQWPVIYYRDEITNKCATWRPFDKIYYVFITITLFFVPILIMMVAYLKIICRLWTARIPGEQHEANVNAQSRSKHRVLKMVILVLVAFIICWMPLQINIFIAAFADVPSLVPFSYEEFEWFSYYIAYANSFINPFIYGQYNKDFRDGFCLILHCGCSSRRSGGQTFVMKSVQTVTSTVSSLKNRTPTFFGKRKGSKGKITVQETEIKPTSV